MDDLKAQLATVEQQITDEKAKGDQRDAQVIATLEQQQADILAKMDEAQKTQETEAAVEQAQTQLNTALDNIKIGDETIPLRALTTDESSYQLLYIALQELVADQAQQYSTDMQALKSSYESQIAGMQTDLEDLPNLKAENSSLKDQVKDLESKRDAAASELDELRQQIQTSVKPKEATTNGKDALAAWKANRPKVYNLRWKETTPRETTYLANEAVTGNEIEFGRLEIGKYNVLTEEEALQFRNEQAANAQTAATTEPETETVEQDSVPDSTLGTANAVEPPSQPFSDTPSEEVAAGTDGTGDAAVSTVVAQQAETVEQRISRLETLVDAIRVKVGV